MTILFCPLLIRQDILEVSRSSYQNISMTGNAAIRTDNFNIRHILQGIHQHILHAIFISRSIINLLILKLPFLIRNTVGHHRVFYMRFEGQVSY